MPSPGASYFFVREKRQGSRQIGFAMLDFVEQGVRGHGMALREGRLQTFLQFSFFGKRVSV